MGCRIDNCVFMIIYITNFSGCYEWWINYTNVQFLIVLHVAAIQWSHPSGINSAVCIINFKINISTMIIFFATAIAALVIYDNVVL